MNIHLGTFINNEVEKIRELSESEYNEYNRHWENLQEVKSDFDLLLLLKYNYQAFFDNIQAYLKHVENENLMHFEVEDKFKLEVNRHFLNFLSSFKTFLDHSETSLKRRFGKESDEVKRFKQACSEAFDSHFEYRFFYKLRNYAQHCGLPIDSIKRTTEKDHKAGEYLLHLNIEFDKELLSERYSEWGTKLKYDFMNLPEQLGVQPLMINFFKVVSDLSLLVKAIKQPLIDDAEFFLRRMTETENNHYTKDFKIFLDVEKIEDTLTFKMQTVPLYLLQILK